AQVLVGELRQPLLKNFWIDGTRLNVRLRKKDLQTADLNLRLRLINTVSSVETAYYDLVAARENVKSAEIAFELAKKLYDENKKRVAVGTMAQLDERQAQAQMSASEASMIEAQRSVDFTQNVLKNLLTDKYEEWHSVTIVPAEPLLALPADLDDRAGWEQAFQLRPDLHALIIELERRDLSIRYLRNQLFPQLDVFGSFGWTGNGVEMSDAMGQVTDRTAPRHAYGAVLSFPLSNRRARENYRASKDERAQAELRLRQFRQQVMVGVSDAIQQAQSSFQRVGATKAARQFAEEALKAEETKLANGKSTSFEVLRLQRDLTQARFDETRALTDYNKALATVRQRQGATLLKFNLEAPKTPAQTGVAK
ncbi:MAG: TolC family protein, partial [Verrucomicrobiales bacterium]|nr:TolC family protein [Verrucomicrobiales bacterium]